MLTAFSERINRLASDRRDHFTSNVKKFCPPSQVRDTDAALRRLIVSMPAMLKDIRRWSETPVAGPGIQRLQLFAMAYLYSPMDFLPEKSLGLFGYLDDAFLVANVYERSFNAANAAGILLSRTPGISILDVRRWIATTRKMLPAEMIGIERLLDEVGSRGLGFGSALATAARGGPAARSLRPKARLLKFSKK